MTTRSIRHGAVWALVLGTCVSAGAWAHEHKGAAAAEKKTLAGELLDMNCYMAHEGKGEKHKQCAATCIDGGAPMGLLTSDGKVYLLVADHALKDTYDSLKEKAGEQVKVSGEVYHRGGVQALLVKSVDGGKPAESSK